MGASAGLSAASGLLDDPAFAETAKGLEDLLLQDFVRNGSLVKHDATAAVDASLLWLALPLGVVAMDDGRHQPQLVIFRVWADYPMYAQIDRSARTVSFKL